MAETKLTKRAARILRDQVNAMLAAPGGTREARIALHVLLEKNLHAARIYRGFGYLEINMEAVDRWHKFIDMWHTAGSDYGDAYQAEYKRLYAEAFGDDTRVVYYADRA